MDTREAEGAIHIREIYSQGRGDSSGTCRDECH